MKVETSYNGGKVLATHSRHPGDPQNEHKHGIELTSGSSSGDWASIFLTEDEALKLAQYIFASVEWPTRRGGVKVETSHNGSIVTITSRDRLIELTMDGHDSDPFDCHAYACLTEKEALALAQYIFDSMKEPVPDPHADLKRAIPQELLRAVVYFWKWGKDGRLRTEYRSYISGLRQGFKPSQPGGWKSVTPDMLTRYRNRSK